MSVDMEKKNILLIEDSEANALVYKQYLSDGYMVTVATNGKEASALFEQNEYDLILLDVQLPDISGLELLKQFRLKPTSPPIVIITAHGSVNIALDAMREGANDFLSKPFDKARLDVTVAKLLREKQLEKIIEQYEKTYNREGFGRMVGNSLPMQNVYNIIQSCAASKATVFITGESGTGKELCAEAIHQTSPRAEQEFVALNCAAIPAELLESEIFGHVKGAFTGASSNREGAATRAHQGTLFLDEIGEMPLNLQSKLLRFIQTGKFQPVGSNKEFEVDIRIVCATNRDPLEEVRKKRFREDLYYRLHVIPIHMPPLRERDRDVIAIARKLLESFNKDEGKRFLGFSNDSEKALLDYHWPGNVRELSNVIRNILVLNDREIITPDMLPFAITSTQISQEPERENASILPMANQTVLGSMLAPSQLESGQQTQTINSPSELGFSNNIKPLWIAEKEYIEKVIEQCNGNIPKAAAFLEISASTIYRKKQQWEKLLDRV